MDIEYDGLYVDEVGCWAEKKHNLIRHYAEMFSTSMKDKWQNLIYIDLFSSSGIGKIKGTDNLVYTSPLLALGIKNKFTKYIFCEIDEEKIETLKKRVKLKYGACNVSYILGDVNETVARIPNEIPKYSKNNKVLSFCVVDPYNIDNLAFNTIRYLSKLYMDFLILIPSYMDGHRNESYYIRDEDQHVEKFLDLKDWRNDWAIKKMSGMNFGRYLPLRFNERMSELDFIPLDESEFELIRKPDNNSPLYHLSFYSRSSRGKQFWNEARKSSTQQLSFNL
jgi:three-Cys-motif partner protein